PDTSGIMRLLGMERSGVEVGLSESTAYPAAPPLDGTLQGLWAGAAPVAGNRGRLYYEGYPYETGSKPGPYTVSDSPGDPTPGEDLVLDFDLEDDHWVGAQIPLSGGGPPADLSAAEGIVVSYRAMDVEGEFDLYLQIGALGEDLDDDGRLDEELSEAASGFAFDDTSQGAVLRVGTDADNQPNGRLDSEDMDGSGFLDAEDLPEADSILTVPIETTITADGGWSVARVGFTAAQKRRLSRVRSLRLIAVESGAAPAAAGARVLIDRITLAGSRFWGSPPDGTVSVREVEEWAAENEPPQSLDDAFPDVEELFHPLGERQKVLEVEWTGATDWSVQGFTEAASEGIDYRSIVYYYRLPEVDGSDDLSFALHDDQGGSIEWTLPAASTVDAWQEVRVDRDERQVYRNGTMLPGASVSRDTASGSLTRLTIDRSGTSSGLLYLDELHLTDPRAGLGAAASLQLDLQLPGTLWEAGGHPLLHDVRIREEAEITTAGFAGLYGTPAEALSLFSRSELEAGVSLADVFVSLEVAAQEEAGGLETSVGGSHRVTLPNVPFPLRVSDSYSYRQRDTGPALLRESSVLLDFAPLLQGRFYHTAGNVEDTLTQSWEALLALTPGSFSFDHSLAIDVARSGFSVPREGYFRNWAWGYSLLWPTEEGAPLERRELLSLDWRLLPQPVGLTLAGSLVAHSYELGSSARTQESRFALELSVPVELAGTETAPARLTLEPGYRRTLELLDREPALGDVPADLAGAFTTFGSQRYAFTGVPFWELYDPSLESRFLADSPALDSASYLAEPYVSLSRTFSSRLLDLLLPSYLEIALGKSLDKEGELTRLGNRYDLQSRWRAVNLFGRFGAYPLVQGYRTDEYGTDLVLSLLTEQGGEVRVEELRIEHALGFENGEAGALSVENRFRLSLEEALEWSDSLLLALDWFRYPAGGVALPLLPPEVGADAFWSHRESLSVELGGPLADATSWHPFNLILRHLTALNLPDRGLLSAGAGLGLDLERTTAGELYWRVGIEGTIAVEIRF
ncbi:MAG: hypothetical protein JW820_03785, partial [Spirochaetales bacterium]|nr:hypothetical protein [Spirochaetales bacterium]